MKPVLIHGSHLLRDLAPATVAQIFGEVHRQTLAARRRHVECNPQQTISTPTGLVWLDFEAACLGPKEWDLATMDKETVESFGTIDRSIAVISVEKSAALVRHYLVLDATGSRPGNSPRPPSTI